MSIKEKILSKSIRTRSGCLKWVGSTTTYGYGLVFVGPKRVYAHRAMWESERGKIPEGLCVLHKCDNPPCVDIDHLFLGTRKDNMRDMDTKGRRAVARGSACGASKLTEADVARIRLLYNAGTTQAELAIRFGVRVLAIFEIIHRKTWKHVA